VSGRFRFRSGSKKDEFADDRPFSMGVELQHGVFEG